MVHAVQMTYSQRTTDGSYEGSYETSGSYEGSCENEFNVEDSAEPSAKYFCSHEGVLI